MPCAARRLSAQAAAGGELAEWVQRSGGSVQGVAVQQWGGEGEAAGFGLKAVQVGWLVVGTRVPWA